MNNSNELNFFSSIDHLYLHARLFPHIFPSFYQRDGLKRGKYGPYICSSCVKLDGFFVLFFKFKISVLVVSLNFLFTKLTNSFDCFTCLSLMTNIFKGNFACKLHPFLYFIVLVVLIYIGYKKSPTVVDVFRNE